MCVCVYKMYLVCLRMFYYGYGAYGIHTNIYDMVNDARIVRMAFSVSYFIQFIEWRGVHTLTYIWYILRKKAKRNCNHCGFAMAQW